MKRMCGEMEIDMVRFKKGDMIMYGTSGVCEVKDTCPSPFEKMNNGSLYYVLEPLGSRDGSMIYSPTDNQSVSMRALMTRDEAMDFVSRIPTILPIEIDNDKNRKMIYREAMETGLPDIHVGIIKSIYDRRKQLLKSKKRLPDIDADYERLAKHCLYGELSVSLDIPYTEVEDYIKKVAEAI